MKALLIAIVLMASQATFAANCKVIVQFQFDKSEPTANAVKAALVKKSAVVETYSALRCIKDVSGRNMHNLKFSPLIRWLLDIKDASYDKCGDDYMYSNPIIFFGNRVSQACLNTVAVTAVEQGLTKGRRLNIVEDNILSDMVRLILPVYAGFE